MKMNVAYLRVSTEAQTEKYGLDMQKQKILDYCNKEGVVIDKWYIDGGYSGAKLDRPKITELLKDAEKGKIDKVYIYKLDRMSRDVIDTLNLLYRVLPEYGVKIISMTEDLRFENPMDKVMVGVNAIMGQYEREVIYMRTRAGMLERVKKGMWMGGNTVPFGYYYDRNDGVLHPNEEEADIVKKAFKMYLDGYSCARISEVLYLKNEPNVRAILKRKSYIGLIEYKGKVYKGLHEPIVDEETFYAVQAMWKKRSRNTYIANAFMLSGLCHCGVCGARMRYLKYGKYHKLVCYSQIPTAGKQYMIKDLNCCNSRPPAYGVEDEVEDCFKRFQIDVEKQAPKESVAEMLEKEIQKQTAKIKRLYNLYSDNGSENLISVIKDNEDNLNLLKRQLAEEQKNNSATNYKIEKIRRISDVWDALNVHEKNKVLKECIEKIIVNGSDLEIHFTSF